MNDQHAKRSLAFAFMATGALVFSGCATGGAKYEPIVDGPRDAAYQSDLQDCQTLAEQKRYDGEEVRTGAAVGAGLGALLGLIDGGGAGDAAAGAAVGASIGGGGSALEVREERAEIVKRCMTGRGHRVVG